MTWMQTRDTKHLTMNEFVDAVAKGKPGDEIVYAIGDLAHDAGYSPELKGLRSLTQDYYETDRGHLTQRRLGRSHFQYIFTVATPKKPLANEISRAGAGIRARAVANG